MLTETFGVGMSRKPTQFHLCVVREQTIALINDEINGSNFRNCAGPKRNISFLLQGIPAAVFAFTSLYVYVINVAFLKV